MTSHTDPPDRIGQILLELASLRRAVAEAIDETRKSIDALSARIEQHQQKTNKPAFWGR